MVSLEFYSGLISPYTLSAGIQDMLNILICVSMSAFMPSQYMDSHTSNLISCQYSYCAVDSLPTFVVLYLLQLVCL